MAKRAQHVAPNNLVICCIDMLRPFGRGLKDFRANPQELVFRSKSQGILNKWVQLHFSFGKIIDIEIMFTHFICACLDSVSAELISFLQAVNQQYIISDVWLRNAVC